MAEVTNELVVEILRKIQADISGIKATLAEHSNQLINIRKDIHELRGDDLRRETAQVQMDMRLERIEARLDLRDS